MCYSNTRLFWLILASVLTLQVLGHKIDETFQFTKDRTIVNYNPQDHFAAPNKTDHAKWVPRPSCSKSWNYDSGVYSSLSSELDTRWRDNSWGQDETRFWTIDVKNLGGWDSAGDCLFGAIGGVELCMSIGAADAFIQQSAGFADCDVHVWLNGV